MGNGSTTSGAAVNPLVSLAESLSRRSRARRIELFHGSVALDATTRILDLGSEDGRHIHKVLEGTGVDPANVYIADIDERRLREG
jgi:hypothetical protein